MLKIPSSPKQFETRRRSTNSSPFPPFHSNLTAALHATGNGSTFPHQLSLVGQVSDLAGRGENEDQYLSSFDTGLPAAPLKSGEHSIGTLPKYVNATQHYDSPGPGHTLPWNHLHAFSAPDPQLAPFPNQPAPNSPGLYPCSQDGFGSFEASWNADHLPSLNVQSQGISFGAVNESFGTFDDFFSTPIEQEDFALGYVDHLQTLDRSRASSISKPAYSRSPGDYPLSNFSFEENTIQSPTKLPNDGVEKDELSNAILTNGFRQTYEADAESILNGLKSPVHQHFSEPILEDAEDLLGWPMNNGSAKDGPESTTELFPELFESDRYQFQVSTLESMTTNANAPSSDSFKDDFLSSSPPTTHDSLSQQAHDSTSMQRSNHAVNRRRRVTLPTASPNMGNTNQSNLPFRSSSIKSKAASNVRRSRRNSFNENRKPLPPSQLASNARRGGRVGGLDRVQAEKIKVKRKLKLTCIRCRLKRITCEIKPGTSECQHCLKQGCGCVRADFAEMTTLDTCNFIFQKSLSHITRDGLRRTTIDYPARIDADWLLNQVAIQHKHSNIEVNSITGAVWTIDLAKCYELLSKLPWQQGARRLDLDDLVHNRRISLASWLDCMEPEEDDDEFEQLLRYTNMPNRNTYALLPLSKHQPSRQLDIDHNGERDLILMAAQLCRIILRALELKGFRTLQKDLGDISRLVKISDKEAVVYRTGQLVGTMRWRLASWELASNAAVDPEFNNRVKNITWSLYFWFLFAKQQLPEENREAFAKGTHSYYAETERTWDEFPQSMSLEGFQTWLHGAHSLIQKSLAAPTSTFSIPEQLIQLPDYTNDPIFQEPLSGWHLPVEPRKSSYDDSETNMTWEF